MTLKEKALEKMLDEMNQAHTGAEDKIHNFLCDQTDDKLFEGILKEGKTTIIFVRKKDHKNKSLYTLEFRNQKIIQFRSKHNQNVPENVTKIANKWLKAVTKGAHHGA